MIRFEKVSRFKDVDITMPERKTTGSAGYDLEVAEDIIIPSYTSQIKKLTLFDTANDYTTANIINGLFNPEGFKRPEPKTLKEIAAITKESKAKPTLVSTGLKCYLDPNTYLELSVRSSTPLKYWLVLANGVGIIDADYADNPDNEGEIYLQLINLAPFDIKLQKGDCIGQGIIKPYLITSNDRAEGERMGGFGSTEIGI